MLSTYMQLSGIDPREQGQISSRPRDLAWAPGAPAPMDPEVGIVHVTFDNLQTLETLKPTCISTVTPLITHRCYHAITQKFATPNMFR